MQRLEKKCICCPRKLACLGQSLSKCQLIDILTEAVLSYLTFEGYPLLSTALQNKGIRIENDEALQLTRQYKRAIKKVSAIVMIVLKAQLEIILAEGGEIGEGGHSDESE